MGPHSHRITDNEHITKPNKSTPFDLDDGLQERRAMMKELERSYRELVQGRPSHETCRFCKCNIEIDARKCQHCKEWLDGTVEHNLVSNIIAGILSMICPGAGQIYFGELTLGIIMFSAVIFYSLGALTISMPFVLVALAIHFLSVVRSLAY
jgi:hypothetical protein